jgi:hypothetical protein
MSQERGPQSEPYTMYYKSPMHDQGDFGMFLFVWCCIDGAIPRISWDHVCRQLQAVPHLYKSIASALFESLT